MGVTQYGDALQRGEFQHIPGFSANYHVLLGTPTIAPTVTITVTSATQGNLYRLRSGGLVGVVASGFFDAQLNALVHGYAANTLPIFLTDNVFEGFDGTINTCCMLGYHNSQGPPASTAKTWIFAAYTEPGTFRNDVILDVQPLSHEVAEWLNDPFVGAFAVGFLNFIPPAVLPGQGGACIVNFETGTRSRRHPRYLRKPPMELPIIFRMKFFCRGICIRPHRSPSMVGTRSGIRLPRSRPFVGQANKCGPFNPDRFSEEKSKELDAQRLGLPASHCLENAIPPIAHRK